MGLFVSEWLPNPIGNDVDGEWVEIGNSGPGPESLYGWRLRAGKRSFVFGDESVGPGEHIVVPRSESGLVLGNQDGQLFLEDGAGRVVDNLSFAGQAPEGKSANNRSGAVFFAEPTPGKTNTEPNLAMITDQFPPGTMLRSSAWIGEAAVVGLIAACLIASLIVFAVYSNHALRELLITSD